MSISQELPQANALIPQEDDAPNLAHAVQRHALEHTDNPSNPLFPQELLVALLLVVKLQCEVVNREEESSGVPADGLEEREERRVGREGSVGQVVEPFGVFAEEAVKRRSVKRRLRA